jgi:hypothetical protein
VKTPAALAAAALLAGCADRVNQVSGSVNGVRFDSLSSAYWIGKPSAGGAPMVLFLFEKPASCEALGQANWDKVLGDAQLLEIGTLRAEAGKYPVPTDAYAAYLRGEVNPDAEAGAVTVTALNPNRDAQGTFEAHYGAEVVKGTFDAEYCPGGVEP